MHFFVKLTVLLACFVRVSSFPTGAPLDVCDSMEPQHPAGLPSLGTVSMQVSSFSYEDGGPIVGMRNAGSLSSGLSELYLNDHDSFCFSVGVGWIRTSCQGLHHSGAARQRKCDSLRKFCCGRQLPADDVRRGSQLLHHAHGQRREGCFHLHVEPSQQ